MKIQKILSCVAAAMLLVSAAFAAKAGEKAPNFSLTDINGNEVSLSDYAGKIVVLEWTNYGCPFVKKHYRGGNMQNLQGAMKDDGVVWLSICSSAKGKQGSMSPSDWQSTVKDKGVQSAAVLLDESGKVGRMYDARATPHMFVIDTNGVIAYNGAIDSIASASQADIASAENYVVSAVKALQAGEAVETKSVRPYGCGIKYARRDS